MSAVSKVCSVKVVWDEPTIHIVFMFAIRYGACSVSIAKNAETKKERA